MGIWICRRYTQTSLSHHGRADVIPDDIYAEKLGYDKNSLYKIKHQSYLELSVALRTCKFADLMVLSLNVSFQATEKGKFLVAGWTNERILLLAVAQRVSVKFRSGIKRQSTCWTIENFNGFWGWWIIRMLMRQLMFFEFFMSLKIGFAKRWIIVKFFEKIGNYQISLPCLAHKCISHYLKFTSHFLRHTRLIIVIPEIKLLSASSFFDSQNSGDFF